MATLLPELQLGQGVCPGDVLCTLPDTGVVRIGGGVAQEGGRLVAVKPGRLQQAPKSGKVWVESRQRRYIPSVDDVVVGRVTDKHSDAFGVDIGAPFRAALPLLAFEGATKRNRPALAPGDLVYARVEGACRDLDPALTCVDAAGKASGFGPLKGGTLIEISTSHARALLARPPAAVLAALGATLQFEAAVGLNGRVWIDAPCPSTAILVGNAILSSEHMSPAQQEALVAALLKGSVAAARQQQQQRRDGEQQQQQQTPTT